MPLLPFQEAPSELLSLFHTEKESILARCLEPEPGLFIAESAKVTVRAADAGYSMKAMLIDDAQLNREAQELLSRFPEVPAYHAPTREYLEISGYPMTRGVLSLFRRKQRSRPDPPDRAGRAKEDPFSLVSSGSYRRIAVLEEVSNPANIGSIFRNAAALGIDAVLLSAGCCDPLARRCLRVSMGCIFQVPWSMTGLSGAQIAETLKELGIRTAAMALSADSVPVSDPSLKEALRLAVFLGNEGNGLPAKTIGSCDLVVRIPMRDGVDSLNVAAASAVTFWETRRP